MRQAVPNIQRNSFAAVLTAAASLGVLLGGGCSRPAGVPEVYGTLETVDSQFSINGTSVFAEAIRRQGKRIVISRRITPKVERYGTIVWFAAKGSGCPDPEICDRINLWLENGPNRKLVFVGWDADAAVEFWTDAAADSSGETAMSMLRRRAEAMAEFDGGSRPASISPLSCKWFRIEQGTRQKPDRLVDQRGRGIDNSSGSAALGLTRLMPVGQANSRPLLQTEDGIPLVFSTASSPTASGHNVFVVSNSSFLLNYSLLNPVNRELASSLLQEIGTIEGPVMFLHSGPVDHSDAIYEKHTAWSWINQPPVRYIVPHILVIGLVFIFSVFPVLGRPKMLEAELQPGLGRHVDATGQLIVRSGNKAGTEKWLIQHAQTHSGLKKAGSARQTG